MSTLKFLGETDEAAIPKIIAAMDKATKGVAPFKMQLKHIQDNFFPSKDCIRVVWVGMYGAEPFNSNCQGPRG